MLKKIEHEFIATSKVIIFKMGIDGAAVLATLIYKYDYWEKVNKITIKENFKGFHISHSDIMEETCFGLSRIKKAINILKEEGLIMTIRQGLGKPNLYSVDKEFVNKYIKKHNKGYKNYRIKIRQENSSGGPVNAMIVENELSRELKIDHPESSKSTTTKNKNTKNKKLKTLTNRTSAEVDFDDLELKLRERIENLREVDFDNLNDASVDLYNFLRNSIPMFKKFCPSEDDIQYMESIYSSRMDVGLITSKIVNNAKLICNGSKDARFGNLFIGLQEIARNMELKYTA